MYWAQFFRRSLTDGQPVEACGDRAVIILDGRIRHKTMGEIAERECVKRGYIAWRIYKGEGFNRPHKPVSGLWYVNTDKPAANPVWLSAVGM